jgi:hypothetical protein
MRRPSTIVACVLVLGSLSGCGADGSERDVAATVARFQAALDARDGQAACAELTPAARRTLVGQEQAPCPRAVLGLALRGGGTVTKSDVYLTSAIAEIDGRGSAFLDQTPAGWRISAAGCAPTTADRPYDCELEA